MANCGCTNTTPCTSQECGCKFEVDAGCVRYTGDTLSCIDAQTGDRLSDILLNLNEQFCSLVAGNYIEVSQEVAGANCEFGGLKIVVKDISTSATINTEYLCETAAPVYEEVITFSTELPTEPGVVFTPNTPETEGVLYVSEVDTTSWIWDGIEYQTAPDISLTPWNLYGTYTDAGGNKVSPVSRVGSIYVASDSYFNGVRVGMGRNNITSNTTVGKDALLNNTTGSFTVAVGYETLKSNTVGVYNSAVGARALTSNTTGNYNTAFGENSMLQNTSGTSNIAFGLNSLMSNLIGSANVAVGYQALQSNLGSSNTAVGANALSKNTTGLYNTAIGQTSLYENTVGNENVAIGYYAGAYAPLSLLNTGSTNSVFIGNYAKALTAADDNQVVIGSNALGKGSNTVQIGNTAVVRTYLQGDITISNATSVTTAAVTQTKYFPIVINGVTYKLLLAD